MGFWDLHFFRAWDEFWGRIVGDSNIVYTLICCLIYFCVPSAFLTSQLTQDVVHIQLRCDTYLHMIQCLKYAFHKGEVSQGAVFAVDHTEEPDLPS